METTETSSADIRECRIRVKTFYLFLMETVLIIVQFKTFYEITLYLFTLKQYFHVSGS